MNHTVGPVTFKVVGNFCIIEREIENESFKIYIMNGQSNGPLANVLL